MREAARLEWARELDDRRSRAALLRGVTKVKRALDDKQRAGDKLDRLPRLAADELAAVEEDLLWHRHAFGIRGEVPTDDLWRQWVAMFDVRRGLRGAGHPELRPGLFSAAFVMLDWFRARHDRLPRARLYSKSNAADVDDWSARADGIAYAPSADVEWLAAELALLDPSLGQPDNDGRPLALHQAARFVDLWRGARGLISTAAALRKE
jgi:hypothetical protein